MRLLLIIISAALPALLCAACAQSPALTQPLPQRLTPGRDAYTRRCARCHELLDPEDFTQAQWKRCVDKYAPRSGASARESEIMLDFLRSYAADAEPR